METKTKCTQGQDHRMEYHSTQDGKQYMCCFLCGEFQWIYEEHNGG